jgi:UDP-2,3-diacylglucosamine pyrophosphatase LpxH
MRPLVIVSDVHLGHRRCDDVADDLARLVASHPEHEIILNGDTFNLACDPWSTDPAVSAPAMIAAHPELRTALEGHLAAGGHLTFVAGNHDMALQRPGVRVALASLLGRNAGRSTDAGSGPSGADARLSIEPWILRRGAIHIEHGHLYDPGNSPTHPLAEPSPRAEPVGMELTRRFVGPYDLWEVLADRWTNRPAENLGVMYDKLGWGVVTSSLYYCGLLGLVNLETAVPARLNRDRRAGEAALPAFATRVGLPEGTLRGLVAGRHEPMHFSFAATFMRFGFDALAAIAALPGGIAAAILTRRPMWLLLSAAGLGYLVAARDRLAHRGANHMPEDLREGAALVHHLTDARLVILGHTHREDEMEGYLNLGAFGDRPATGARTYVHVDEAGNAARCTLPATASIS